MTDLEAIARRTSRRAYHGKLTTRAVSLLQQAITKANLQSGLSIQLVENGTDAFGGITKSYGMFSGVRSLMVLAGPQDLPHLKELCGYYGELLVLEATKMGLGTCWVGGTYDRKRLAGSLPQNQTLVAVVTVGPVAENKSLMEKTIRKISGGKRKAPAQIYTAGDTPPAWFANGIAAALCAPSAMNRQPVHFVYTSGSATAEVAQETGLNLVDLGIAKLHFELGANGQFAPGNPGVFAPGSPE